jgi:N-acetyl-anhydromuramyl-L-alanine amidase AmpD
MNSPLVDYIKISPNSTNPRKDKIRKITIHHAAGVASVETLGNIFAPKSKQSSANYGIGSDGRIGMYVEEKNRAWTSGNKENDHQAITIEVSNSKSGNPWPVSDNVLNKLIDLCVDICRRNNIDELIYTGDKNGNLTRHNMFQATTCPGPYLQSKFPYIAEEVNKRLKEGEDVLNRTLKHGMKGEDVGIVQKLLKNLGYYNGPIDNSFGPGQGFLKAVKAFQEDNGLEPDGSIGPKTRDVIIDIMLNPKADTKKVKELEAEIKRYKSIIAKIENYIKEGVKDV